MTYAEARTLVEQEYQCPTARKIILLGGILRQALRDDPSDPMPSVRKLWSRLQ